MREPMLRVRMFGNFSMCKDDLEINDNDNRSRKIWLLLAYMIYRRNHTISQDELINLLWSDGESSSNPLNALKTMFHRARTALNQLGDDSGHNLIIRRSGNYAWNTDIPFFLDVDEFERLCRAGAAESDPTQRVALYEQALDLYRGDFLQKLSSEPWVISISVYFHNLYVQTLLDTLPLLESSGQHQKAAALCRQAVEVEPYNELIYQHLMQNLLALNDQRGTLKVYEDMSQLLFDNFGIMPSEESLALYREAGRTTNDRTVSLSTIREQLREDDGPRGALMCEYDFFKVIYRSEARAVARRGAAAHLCLLTVTDQNGDELPKRSLERCMDNLQELICTNLRQCDVAARCSVSQYIFLLPQANYENSCMVCDRVVKSFCRQYPHSPGRLHYTVQPLDPI